MECKLLLLSEVDFICLNQTFFSHTNMSNDLRQAKGVDF